MGEKRDAHPVVELRIARAFEALEAQLDRIEGGGVERELRRIGEDDEHGSLAEDAPGHAFLDEDAAHAAAQLFGGALSALAGVGGLYEREHRDARRGAKRIGV